MLLAPTLLVASTLLLVTPSALAFPKAQQPQLVFDSSPSAAPGPSPDAIPSDAMTGREIYEGYSVHRVTVDEVYTREALIEMAEILHLDIWSHQPTTLDILLPPSLPVSLLQTMAASLYPSISSLDPDSAPPLSSTPFIPASTFSTLLADTYSSPPSPFALPSHSSDFLAPLSFNETHPLPPSAHPFHHAFRNLDSITRFLSLLQESYPELVTLENIGTSAEGRPIPSIRIGVAPSPSSSDPSALRRKKKGGRKHNPHDSDETPPKVKRTSVILAGQHAREWIATSTALYYAHFLLAHSDKREIKHLLTNLDFLIVPVLNVDGYEFSHTTSRLWRKNRQVVDEDSGCIGVDLNRNWGFQWSDSFASSDTPLSVCSESYPGTSAFSTHESLALSTFLTSPPPNSNSTTPPLPPISFLDLHAYGQLLLYPYSFSCSSSNFPPDAEDLSEAALGTAKAILHSTIGHHHNGGSHGPGHGGGEGSRYKVGEACEVGGAGRAGGDAGDWGYGDEKEGGLGVKWSFSLEAPDTGTYGFLMPPSSIVPVGEETTQGLLYLAQFILKKGL